MATLHVSRGGMDQLIGSSLPMQQLRERIHAVAARDVTLLLQGESGTGKELVSRMVHDLSGRCEGPFIGVNCAAIHETLLESELFGHEAGAFTGAAHPTLGFLRAAEGGTILLDEIGDMSDSLQSKLLRVLEQRAVVPVGSARALPIDVRVIAATHRDLAHAVVEGTFRQDLYYRLNVVRLHIPPLRERRKDVSLLADQLLARVAEALDMPRKTLSSPALAVLTSYNWPGNVRELGNVIQRAYVLGHGSVIDVKDFPEELLGLVSSEGEPLHFPTLREVTREHVRKALEASGGVRSQAARMLGVDRKSLWRMMRRYHGES